MTMEYVEQLRGNELFQRCPFEHVFRNVSQDAFIARLTQQRNVSSEYWSSGGKNAFVKLVITLDEKWDANSQQKLNDTILMWACQSLENVIVEVAVAATLIESVEQWLLSGNAVGTSTAGVKVVASSKLTFSDAEYIVFGSAGELHHPALAHSLFTSARNNAPEIVNWNYQLVDKKSLLIKAFQRVPKLEKYSLLANNYVRNAVAMSSRLLQDQPLATWGTVKGRQSIVLSAALDDDLVCETIPEYLHIIPEAENEKVSDSEQIARYHYLKNAELILPSLRVLDGDSAIFVPRQSANSISVCIPFRDKPEMTIQCMENVARQNISGQMEILLVNNQSAAESVGRIAVACRKIEADHGHIVRCDIVHYNKAFNHSAQCNLAIEQAVGEVIVLLNNDAVIVSDAAIEQMCAWALEPDVGTVGCRIEEAEGDLLCAGIKSRLNPGYDFNSVVEESREASYADAVRECFANTFAFAAISRRVLEQVGPLNEIEFPNGYNDVEYNLRVRRVHLKNLYLGHLIAQHAPGTSRGKCDELSEKILVRSRFPEMLTDSLFQLERDDYLLQRAKKLSAVASGLQKQVA
ncbi:MAG: glycosyltransferase family 2 protein [Pseudomonadales bacterium]